MRTGHQLGFDLNWPRRNCCWCNMADPGRAQSFKQCRRIDRTLIQFGADVRSVPESLNQHHRCSIRRDTLSAGVLNADGSWTLGPGSVEQPYLNAAGRWPWAALLDSLTITSTATASDGSTASTSTSLTLRPTTTLSPRRVNGVILYAGSGSDSLSHERSQRHLDCRQRCGQRSRRVVRWICWLATAVVILIGVVSTTANYTSNNVSIDLSAGTAKVNGSTLSGDRPDPGLHCFGLRRQRCGRG